MATCSRHAPRDEALPGIALRGTLRLPTILIEQVPRIRGRASRTVRSRAEPGNETMRQSEELCGAGCGRRCAPGGNAPAGAMQIARISAAR